MRSWSWIVALLLRPVILTSLFLKNTRSAAWKSCIETVLPAGIAGEGSWAEPSRDSAAVMVQVTVQTDYWSLIFALLLHRQKKKKTPACCYIHSRGLPVCRLLLDHRMVYCLDSELARMSYAKLTSACLTGSVPLTRGHNSETLSLMTTTGKVPNL